jgi:Right handed beta helix region
VPATINGGTVGNVVISGSGLVFTADGSVAEDLVINNSGGDGIDMFASNGSIVDDYIGTDATGKSAVPNLGTGVLITGSNNSVSGCVISGNLGDGIIISGGSASDNGVQGNDIGVNIAGSAALPNGTPGVSSLGIGILVSGGASDNVIGGAIPSARNIISGNLVHGVLISDQSTNGNVVEGNYIGTDSSGMIAIQNGSSSIYPSGDGVGIVRGASDNTIGGTVQGQGNPGLTHHNSESGLYGKFRIPNKLKLLPYSLATFR